MNGEIIYRANCFGNVFVYDGHTRIGPLDPRLDLRNHSPTGLSWGYLGSGCSQLALALISDALGLGGANDKRAVAAYQRFKELKVATVNKDARFEITRSDVLKTLGAIEDEQRGRT